MRIISSLFWLAFVSCAALSLGDKSEPVIYLIGDSTMADQPTDENPQRGWGQLFPEYFRSGVRIENHAKNGRSTKSFRDQGLWDIVFSKLKPGDYVFIQFGHNDSKISDTLRYAEVHTAYRENLIRYIKEVRTKGATPVLLTPVNRRKFNDAGTFIDQHGDYPVVVREIAVAMNVPLVDLHKRSQELFQKLGPEKTKPIFLFIQPKQFKGLWQGKEDNTHFSYYGASVIANLVCEEMKYQNLPLSSYLRDREDIHPFLKIRSDIVVAQGGTGSFKSIQRAIDAVPENIQRQYVILIKDGVYNEKLFIEKSNITFIGESQSGCKIEYAILRKQWREDHPDDWGAAVVNIKNDAANIIFSDLTVINNYGSLNNNNDHQFAIRGGGTKIILTRCSVISAGGDALSLWNAKNGMYYHNNCYFEGYVDYVCPRGWCYITGSKFFGHNLSASIWMDGDMDPSQKFVINNSSFDGTQNFALGRHHREAAFYLINCSFSKTMADKPIYFCGPSPIKLYERYYYFNCHRAGGDYFWFKDNLTSADQNLKAKDINPVWTFGGRWDPEKFIADHGSDIHYTF